MCYCYSSGKLDVELFPDSLATKLFICLFIWLFIFSFIYFIFTFIQELRVVEGNDELVQFNFVRKAAGVLKLPKHGS